MALNLTASKAKLAKASKSTTGKKVVVYKPVVNENRFVIAKQDMKSGDITVKGKIYDTDVNALLKSGGKLNDNFATLRKVNGELYLVGVTATDMVKIQKLAGKEIVSGNEFAQLVVTEKSPAANKYPVGTVLTNDLRKQLSTRSCGTKVKTGKNCEVFTLPINNINLTAYGKLLGRDFLEKLEKKPIEFTIGKQEVIDLPVRTNVVDITNTKKTVRYTTANVTVSAWKLTPKASKIVVGSENVETELSVKA